MKDLRILCSENFFITENTEWVSFVIIAESFQELISKSNIPEACTSVGNAPVHGCAMQKMTLTLMKFKGLDIHLIRG